MANLMQEWQAGGNISTNIAMKQQMATVNGWANSVVSTGNPSQSLYVTLQSFSQTLLSGSGPQASPLALCSQAILTSWQLPSNPKSPVDDRQYYEIMNQWVLSLISLQMQAIQMIQSANLYL